VLTVVAAADTTAPTLVSSAPANNATGVSIGTSVTFNFSEPMNPNLTFASFSPQGGGTNSIWLNGNTTLKLSLLQSPAPLPGQPSLPSNAYSSNTVYTVNLDGEDEAGNALSGTKSFVFTTQNVQDLTAPTLLDTIPAAGAQGVSPGLGKTFTATFSEQMGSSVLNAINFVPNAGATNCVFTNPSNTTVQCTPTTGLLANQFYIMTITTAAKDVAGNPLAQLNSISFNTGPTPDTTQPKIVSITPGDTAVGIDPLAVIKVQFSEPMDKVATQAAFSYLVPSIVSSNLLFVWNAAGTLMTVAKSTPFLYGTAVIWSVGLGAKDLSGNILEGASSALRGFTVIHKGTFKLYSDGSLDGAISDTGSVNLPTASDYIEQVGYSGKQAYKRGFITFDLQKLPKLALITTIQSASLHVYQDASQCGSPYSFLGNMLAENIDYPLLSFLFFDAAPVSTGTTNILSTDAAVGYKAMDATKQIGYDVQNHSGLSNRSQWRLRMTKDFPAQATNTCYFMFMATGMATQSKKPYLDITYLYP
jgi:Bacterial Ig-like domain